MIYRINYQHFYIDMIQFFTLEEITHFHYAVISAMIKVGNKMGEKIVKIGTLYPDPDIVRRYSELKESDKNQAIKIAQKEYYDMLEDEGNRENNYWTINRIYESIVNPFVKHNTDIILMCDKDEDIFMDVLCKFIKKKFHVEIIDLNELFTKGELGPIYIDRSKIRNDTVKIAKNAAKEEIERLSQSPDGRMKLIANMFSNKDKVKKLKELGITVNKSDENDTNKLNLLLIDGWVDEGD